MFDDHLSVEVGYAWEQVSDGCFGLSINFLLCLGQLPRISSGAIILLTNLFSGLLDNCPSNVMTHAMDLECELLDVFVVLGVCIVRGLDIQCVVKIR